MAQNNYVSNSGGGFQGPASDYWMYGLADMAPARDQAAHQMDQVRNAYIADLASRKATGELADYQADQPLRDATRSAGISAQQLANMNTQGEIERNPLAQKKKLLDLQNSFNDTHKDQFNKDREFISKHYRELKSVVEESLNKGDLAGAQQAWGSFMQTGGLSQGHPMARFTPQNMKLLDSMYQEMVDESPSSTMRGAREQTSAELSKAYDEMKNRKEIAQIGADAGITKAGMSSNKPLNKVENTWGLNSKGEKVQGVTNIYEGGRTEFTPYGEGITTTGDEEVKRKQNEARGKMKKMEESSVTGKLIKKGIFPKEYVEAAGIAGVHLNNNNTPEEGKEGVSKSGKPIVFKNGQWVYK